MSNLSTWTDDALRELSENDLRECLREYKNKIRETISLQQDLETRRLEVELCYLQREVQRREKWQKSSFHNHR